MRSRSVPALETRDEAAIAQTQILVRDALAAGQQAVRELLRVERSIALDVLEPFGRIACGVLDLQHFDATLGFVVRERGAHIGRAMQRAGERNGVLERKLGARALRE